MQKRGAFMTVDSLEVVFYTCIFLLPGFVIKSILDALIPPQRHNETKYFFSCLLYSIVNCAIWSWAYRLLTPLAQNHPVIYWISMLAITIVGASILAFLIGLIKQKECVEWMFSKMKINKVHPVPTAWDYFFAKQEEAWVIVTLKSGKTIYGKYSTESFASSDCEERDLYVEKTYSISEDMSWIEDKKSKGILISKDEIETIEFLS